MHREALVGAPAPRAPADGHLAHGAAAVIEVRERLAHGEIAGGAHVAAAETAREEPLGAPATEAAHTGEARDGLVILGEIEPGEVDLAVGNGARDPDDVLGLALGELHRAQ